MAQVLSTFSRLEQSRFEAFRKAAFHGDAIAKYVAHCLIHEQHRPVSAGNTSVDAPDIRTRIPGASSGPTDRDGKQKARFRNLRPNPHYQRRLVLSELVAPGQAQDITVVVSTLAKEYAQRLVLAARRHTAERLLVNNEEESEAISPEDLLQAFSDRQARGLDPGFFLGGTKTKNATASETSLFLSDPEIHQRYSLSRSVALAAQDEYDKEQEEEGEGEEEDDMKIDNDSEETVGKAADKCEEEKFDNEKEDSDDEEEEEEEDPSEQAMRLFSMHVNRIIARQNGITVVTSDDEEEAKKEEENKKQGELTKLKITPGQEEKEESITISASEDAKEEETKPSTPSTPNHDKPTSVTKQEEEEGTEGQQKESSITKTIEETKAEEPSSLEPKEKEDLNGAIEKPLKSKEAEETIPMDTSADTQTPTEAAEAVETSDCDVAMVTSPDDNAAKEEEKQQEAMPTQPTESTDATPKPPSDTAATSETPEKTDEAIEPPKADATTATEGAPVPAEGETHDAKQEQEIIMIDEDD